MRPRRLPGWRASGVPGLTPGAMGPGPARKGGDSGSRFTEVFRVDMRPLLHAHGVRSEEHTSELQSRLQLVCRLLLAKNNCSVLVAARPSTSAMARGSRI